MAAKVLAGGDVLGGGEGISGVDSQGLQRVNISELGELIPLGLSVSVSDGSGAASF